MAETAPGALLAFSIGPVQDYISAARRTEDLYVGSQLLSQLMGIAHGVIGQQGRVLYPHAAPADPYASLPNRLFAEFPSVEAACASARTAQAQVDADWYTIAQKVQAWLNHPRRAGGLYAQWASGWDNQIAKYLEIAWVAVPVDPQTDYATNLHTVRTALQARKRLNNFAPLEQPGYKCVLFNGWSAMGPDNYAQLRSFWQDLANRLSTGSSAIVLRPEGRERLSALACMKRFAPDVATALSRDVPSTSSIATATYKAALLTLLRTGTPQEQTDLAALLDTYEKALTAITDGYGRTILPLSGKPHITPCLSRLAQKAGSPPEATLLLRFDGDVLYEETLGVNRLYDDYGLQVREGAILPTDQALPDAPPSTWKDISTALETARAAQKALLAGAARSGIARPSRYYAVLMMDGDHIGDILKGLHDPEQHRNLSEALGQFAGPGGPVQRIIEVARPGKLIYAGGDDVLALLPLADILPAAMELQQVYNAVLRAVLPGSIIPTASIGIALAHQQAALDQVLIAARAAEDDAKHVYGRNAICVYALKRSGAPITVGLQYRADGDPTDLQAIEAMRLLIAADVLSPRCASFFAREAPALPDTAPAAMVEAALRRLFIRQSDPQDLYGFWQEHKPSAERLCTLLALEDYGLVNNKLAAYARSADRAIVLQRLLCGQLAERLAALVPGLGQIPAPPGQPRNPTSGTEQLADWLALAAFLARGGAE